MAENCVANLHGVVETFSISLRAWAHGLWTSHRHGARKRRSLYVWLEFNDPIFPTSIGRFVANDTTVDVEELRRDFRRDVVADLKKNYLEPTTPDDPLAFSVRWIGRAERARQAQQA